jgi:hypothetical protein
LATFFDGKSFCLNVAENGLGDFFCSPLQQVEMLKTYTSYVQEAGSNFAALFERPYL